MKLVCIFHFGGGGGGEANSAVTKPDSFNDQGPRFVQRPDVQFKQQKY